jgi:hypothetical protein
MEWQSIDVKTQAIDLWGLLDKDFNKAVIPIFHGAIMSTLKTNLNTKPQQTETLSKETEYWKKIQMKF